MKPIFVLCFLLGSWYVFSQDINVSVNKQNLTTDEPLVLTIEVKNAPQGQVQTPQFPEIEGFVGAGVSTSMSSSFINGVGSTQMRFIKYYYAQKQGSFTLNPFEVNIKGKIVTSPKFTFDVKQGTMPLRTNPLQPKTPEELKKQKELEKGKWM